MQRRSQLVQKENPVLKKSQQSLDKFLNKNYCWLLEDKMWPACKNLILYRGNYQYRNLMMKIRFC